MKKLILFTLFILTAMPMTALAKVLAVLPGNSIQEKIDEAEDNDFIAIFGGTYAEDITIDGKVIRLVEVKGQDVELTGNVTFKNITNPPPFEGFKLNGTDKTLTVNSITGKMLFNKLKTDGAFVVGAGEGSVTIKDSNLGSISHSGSDLSVISCTLSWGYDSGGGNFKTIIFRSTMKRGAFRGNYVWVGYNKFTEVYGNIGDDARFVFIGNEVNAQNEFKYGVYIEGNPKFLIANNYIHNVAYNFRRDDTRKWDAIHIRGGSGVIQNNYIDMVFKNSAGYPVTGEPNLIESQTKNIIIRNNLFGSGSGPFSDIQAPFGTLSDGNIKAKNTPRVHGGITKVEMPVIDDPLFGDTVYQLLEGSPLINAGTENPLYNDRDGTRNDVGPSGGVWYDPEGWTTEKPVVISFDLSSESVLEGIDSEVIISGGRAVSSPSSAE